MANKTNSILLMVLLIMITCISCGDDDHPPSATNSNDVETTDEYRYVTVSESRILTEDIGTPPLVSAMNYSGEKLPDNFGCLENKGRVFFLPESQIEIKERTYNRILALSKSVDFKDRTCEEWYNDKDNRVYTIDDIHKEGRSTLWLAEIPGYMNYCAKIGIDMKGHVKTTPPSEFSLYDQKLVQKILSQTHAHLYIMEKRPSNLYTERDYHIALRKPQKGNSNLICPKIMIYQASYKKNDKSGRWVKEFDCKNFEDEIRGIESLAMVEEIISAIRKSIEILEKVAPIAIGVTGAVVTIYLIVPEPTKVVTWTTLFIAGVASMSASDFQSPEALTEIVDSCENCSDDYLVLINSSNNNSIFNFSDLKEKPKWVIDTVNKTSELELPDNLISDSDEIEIESIIFSESEVIAGEEFSVTVKVNDPDSNLETLFVYLDYKKIATISVQAYLALSYFTSKVTANTTGLHTITAVVIDSDKNTNYLDKDFFAINTDAPVLWYYDSDGDGFGNSNITIESIEQPVSYVANGDDCNDNDAKINPESKDVCNDGIDQDCFGGDEQCGLVWYQDSDNDNFGNANIRIESINRPNGYVSDNTDADDNDNSIYPGAPEICDGKDNNQDNNIDENACGIDIVINPVNIHKRCVEDAYRIEFNLEVTNNSSFDIMLSELDTDVDRADRDNVGEEDDRWRGIQRINSGQTVEINYDYYFDVLSPMNNSELTINADIDYSSIFSPDDIKTKNNIDEFGILVRDSNVEDCKQGQIAIIITNNDNNRTGVRFSVNGSTPQLLGYYNSYSSYAGKIIGDYSSGSQEVEIMWTDPDSGEDFSKNKTVDIDAGSQNNVNFSIDYHEAGTVTIGIYNWDDDSANLYYSVDDSGAEYLGSCSSMSSCSFDIGGYESGTHEVTIYNYDPDIYGPVEPKKGTVSVKADKSSTHIFSIDYYSLGN